MKTVIELINQRINAACCNGKHDVQRELVELREVVLALPDNYSVPLADYASLKKYCEELRQSLIDQSEARKIQLDLLETQKEYVASQPSLRDRLAIAAIAGGSSSNECYRVADKALRIRVTEGNQ